MNTFEFSEVFRRRVKLMGEVLDKKATEYARGDRLSNFKKIAKCLGTTPESACLNLMMKHFVCVMEIVGDLESKVESEKPTIPYLDEKLGDLMNYMVLLEALLFERYGYKANQEINDRVNEVLGK